MPNMENGTGRYVKRFAFWNPSTWAIPALYWDTFSQEQRIHAICRQLSKVIAYADYLGVNVDDIAARLKAIEDGELDEFIVAAIEEWFEENAPQLMEDVDDLKAALPISEFSSDSTVKDAIDTLTGDVTTINGNIDTIDGQIDNLDDRVSALEASATKHMVVIGDSFSTTTYVEQTNLWWYLVAQQYKCTPHCYAQNGKGYIIGEADNVNFAAQLGNAINDTAFDNDDVAYVCILGGYNDCRASNVNQDIAFALRIRNLMNTALTSFPNAKVICAGCNTFENIRRAGTATYNYSPIEIGNYIAAGCALSDGVQYIDITGLLIGAYNLFLADEDGGHPNAQGQHVLANAIISGYAQHESTGGVLTPISGNGDGLCELILMPKGQAFLQLYVSETVALGSTQQHAIFHDDYGILQYADRKAANNLSTTTRNIGMSSCNNDWSAATIARFATSPLDSNKDALEVVINKPIENPSTAIVRIPLYL